MVDGLKADDSHHTIETDFQNNEVDECGEQDYISCSPFLMAQP